MEVPLSCARRVSAAVSVAGQGPAGESAHVFFQNPFAVTLDEDLFERRQ